MPIKRKRKENINSTLGMYSSSHFEYFILKFYFSFTCTTIKTCTSKSKAMLCSR